MKKTLVITSILCLFLNSCNNTQPIPKDIIGKWQCVYASQGPTISSENSVKNMKIQFDEKSYTYQASLTYSETGKYWVEEHNLYTRVEGQEDKNMLIVKLTADSLELGMSYAGMPGKMIYLKVKE